MLRFSKKNKLIYKEKCRTVKKIKSVKNVIIKKSATKVFQVCITSVLWNLALALVLALHCYCGDDVKYGLFSKHLSQRKRQYGSSKNPTVTTNF